MSKLNRQDGTLLTLGTIGALAVAGLVRGGRGSSNPGRKKAEGQPATKALHVVVNEDPVLGKTTYASYANGELWVTGEHGFMAGYLSDPASLSSVHNGIDAHEEEMRVMVGEWGGRGSKAKKKLYHFTVTGKGGFPRDMLRYDSCTVVKQDEAIAFPPPVIGKRPKAWHMQTLPSTFLPRRSVRCVGPRPPTKQRWKGFGWTVEKESRGSKAKSALWEAYRNDPKYRDLLREAGVGGPLDLQRALVSRYVVVPPDPADGPDASPILLYDLIRHTLWFPQHTSSGSGSKAKASKWSVMAKLREHLGDMEYGSERAIRKQKDGWLVEYRDLSGKKRLVIVSGRQDSRGAVSLWTRPVERSQE